MSVSWNDQQCLWWLLEQHQWTIGDLIRFGKYTEVLPDIDAVVLLQLNSQMEELIKKGRRNHALQKPKKDHLLPQASGQTNDVGA